MSEAQTEGTCLLHAVSPEGHYSPDCADDAARICEARLRSRHRALGVVSLAVVTFLAAFVALAHISPSRRHPESLSRADVQSGNSIIAETSIDDVAAPSLVHPQEPISDPISSLPQGREIAPANQSEKALPHKHEASRSDARIITPKAVPTEAPKAAPSTTSPTTSSTSTIDLYAKCAVTGGDCRDAKCCKDPGTQCFAKNEYWAECRTTCDKGIHLTDPDDTPWSCKPIGDKTPGEPKQCSKDGEDCSKTECCAEPGTQCYRKNKYWAACKSACTAGPDLLAPTYETWSCEEVGPRTAGAGEWVAQKGAQPGQDCSQVGYCAYADHQCFRKDEGWAECRTECEKGFKENEWDTPWTCEALGPVTPRPMWPGEPPKGKIASWVVDKCHSEGQNCLDSPCCKSVGWQCFKKNEYWAQCMWECPPAPPPPQERRLDAKSTNATPVPKETWECTAKGPKSWGLSVKGYPSLYCISLYMPSSYEGAIVNQQLDMDAGIFACDGYDVLAADDVTVGTTKTDKILVKTVVIPKIEVGVSQDGTAGNAKLFMAMWDKIIAGKRFRDYDWTIKADPDAVLIPWRIREHMAPHVGENVYVVNCNKFPDSPNFPMMFGSVEIFSSAAMIAYAAGSWKCGQDLPWDAWGEDYYMTHCLDYLGVGRISDFTVVGDNVCTGANCAGGDASFHPFKTPGDWKKCWDQAMSR